MVMRKWAAVLLLVVGLALIPAQVRVQEAGKSPTPSEQAEREAMYYRYLEFASYVKGGSITPHWMADGSSFWYAEGAPANTVIWKVDPKANTKTPLFDTERLRQALTELLGHESPQPGLPFQEFTFVDGEKAVRFAVEDKEFILQLDTYRVAQASTLSEAEEKRLVPRIVRKSFPRTSPDVMEVLSPDRHWFAGVKGHNLWLRSSFDDRRVQLTIDGIQDYEWDVDGAKWSPDSFKLACKKVDRRKVPSVPVVHWLSPTQEVDWVHRPREGGPVPQTELFTVDILSKRNVQIDTGKQADQHIDIIGWRPDGPQLLFTRKNRSHKRLDLMAANPETGATRVVLTETQKTFIGGRAGFRHEASLFFTWVGDGKRFIWMSERDGWNHLYLYDLEGKLIRRLTEGAFPLVQVVAVDEKTGWVYFTAHGDQQRPYDTYLYRVNLEGRGFARLTEATGQHDIRFSPSKDFFVDRHSSVDRPPTVELRRADGTLLRVLSKANIDILRNELKWSPPEEFVVRADDGKTDLYGILYKPYDFDPSKKYPVIDHIYAGPHTTWVPRTFAIEQETIKRAAPALAQLGFVVFIVDGRGTPERGKAFQDVVYGNIGRHEIPDHLATLKQLAQKRRYMDLGRVGVFGGSTGGYMTIRAMLLAPDVYQVGIASAPGSDFCDSAGTFWERYMDLPQNNKEAYDDACNRRLTASLTGKLLIIANTSDVNTPFATPMKMVEALIRAGKPYDLIVLPEQNHILTGTSRAYWFDAIHRYFQEHLKP